MTNAVLDRPDTGPSLIDAETYDAPGEAALSVEGLTERVEMLLGRIQARKGQTSPDEPAQEHSSPPLSHMESSPPTSPTEAGEALLDPHEMKARLDALLSRVKERKKSSTPVTEHWIPQTAPPETETSEPQPDAGSEVEPHLDAKSLMTRVNGLIERARTRTPPNKHDFSQATSTEEAARRITIGDSDKVSDDITEEIFIPKGAGKLSAEEARRLNEKHPAARYGLIRNQAPDLQPGRTSDQLVLQTLDKAREKASELADTLRDGGRVLVARLGFLSLSQVQESVRTAFPGASSSERLQPVVIPAEAPPASSVSREHKKPTTEPPEAKVYRELQEQMQAGKTDVALQKAQEMLDLWGRTPGTVEFMASTLLPVHQEVSPKVLEFVNNLASGQIQTNDTEASERVRTNLRNLVAYHQLEETVQSSVPPEAPLTVGGITNPTEEVAA